MSVKGRLEMIKMMIAAAALATTMLAAAAESEYDFRRRLEVVHQVDRRDPGAKRAANEFEFASGAADSTSLASSRRWRKLATAGVATSSTSATLKTICLGYLKAWVTIAVSPIPFACRLRRIPPTSARNRPSVQSLAWLRCCLGEISQKETNG